MNKKIDLKLAHAIVALVLGICATTAWCSPDKPGIKFCGYCSQEGNTLLGLVSSTKTRWVRVGEMFDGFEVLEFLEGPKVVKLRKGEVTSTISLEGYAPIGVKVRTPAALAELLKPFGRLTTEQFIEKWGTPTSIRERSFIGTPPPGLDAGHWWIYSDEPNGSYSVAVEGNFVTVVSYFTRGSRDGPKTIWREKDIP